MKKPSKPLRVTGVCGWCGAPLRGDLSRTCACRPSTFERVALTAAVVSTALPVPTTPKQRTRIAARALRISVSHDRDPVRH